MIKKLSYEVHCCKLGILFCFFVFNDGYQLWSQYTYLNEKLFYEFPTKVQYMLSASLKVFVCLDKVLQSINYFTITVEYHNIAFLIGIMVVLFKKELKNLNLSYRISKSRWLSEGKKLNLACCCQNFFKSNNSIRSRFPVKSL